MQTIPVLANDEIQEDRPMPSLNHSHVARNLTVVLDQFKDRFLVLPQLSVNLNGWSTVPDLALYKAGTLAPKWMSDEESVSEPPLLVIEILSPKQNLQPLVDKVRDYLSHGVKSCWVVIPTTKTISIFPASGGSRTFVEGIVRDDSLDLEIPLSQMFA